MSRNPGELTPKQQRFVEEYLVDLNATQAAVRAGYSAKNADVTGPRMLGNVGVAARIAQAQAERSGRTGITQEAVLNEWWGTATADANELCEMRRTCCRYCHGVSFQYQRTPAERVNLYRSWSKTGPDTPERRAHGSSTVTGEFDELGGVGYDERKAPHPGCPECFGEGVEKPFFKDTRYLSEAAKRRYAGVKVTEKGTEVKMHDRDAALANTARHLGMFVDKHEHTGRNGGPMEVIVRVAREGRRITAG